MFTMENVMPNKHLTKEYIDTRKYYKKWKFAQSFFEENFIDKTVTFYYGIDKRNVSKMTIKLKREHLQHLLGVKYKLSGKTFWRDLKNNRIVWDKLDFCFYKGVGNQQPKTFENKMSIIDYLPDIITPKARVATSGNYENISLDHLLRTSRPCLALGVKDSLGGGFFNTTLNIRPQISNKGYTKNIKTVYKISVNDCGSGYVIFDLLVKEKTA